MAYTERVNVKINGDASGYERAAKKAVSLSKQFAVGIGAIAVTAGARAVLNYMKESIQLAQTQEDAEKRLETALGRRSKALLDQASALQKITTYGDEAIIEAQSLIAAFVKDEEQIKSATKATLDLAAAKGMDLRNAADLVSKTLGSSTNALSRYGIKVEGSVGSTERLSSMTEEISRVFGGQAAAAADTYSGKIQQLSNKYGDMQEQIGFAVMESGAFDTVLDKLNPAIDDLTTYITDHKDDIGEFAEGLGKMAANALDLGTDISVNLLPPLVKFINLTSQPPSEGGLAGFIADRTGPGFLAAKLREYNDEIRNTERASRLAADGLNLMYDAAGRIQMPGMEDYLGGNTFEKTNGEKTSDPDGGTDAENYQKQLRKRVEALRKSLMDERDLQENWRAEQLALVDEYNNTFANKDDEARQMRLDIAQEYKDRMAEIEGVPAFVAEIEALQDHNKTRAEIELEEYDARLARLEEFKNQEYLTFEKYEELKNAVEEDYAKKQTARQEKVERTIRQMRERTVQLAVSLLSQFAGKSKAAAIAAIAINRGLMLAQTAQNTAAAVMRAYADLGPIAGKPAAAAIGTLGKIQMGIIAAAGVGEAFSAGSGGGSVSSSSSVTTTSGNTSTTTTTGSGEVSSRSVTIYGLDPGNLYTGEQIAELLNEYVADGGKIYIK
ncbi:hypothetical protein [Prosthecochloris sp.]|uniref:hypothetical protein n=1 Tax=Prosthecochloris sp. TaxID=290513 RepID=UPI0025E0F664|nr:hypothetical protein [Prosthecochloris sp.]